MNSPRQSLASGVESDSLQADERWKLALRIAESNGFARAQRLRDFLLYICRSALSNHAGEIHEQQVGVDVFGRRPGYNPAEDNIVRVEARELRKRLDRYFSGEGKSEPFRISVPKGSYVPHFEPMVTPPATQLAMGLFPDTPQPRRLIRFWHVLLVVLLGAIAVLVATRWNLRGTRADGPNANSVLADAGVWASLFPTRAPLSIVVADAALVLVEDITGQRVSLEDYQNRSYQRNLKSGDVSLIAGRPYTDLADVMVTSKILAAVQPEGFRPLVRYPRDLIVRDLDRGNLIFLGSAYSDPWIDEFDPQTNFRVVRDAATGALCFANKSPHPGELPQYCARQLPSQGEETYGLVTFLPNLQQTGNVLILEGTTGAGTEATGDFITNPRYASRLRSFLDLRSGARLPYFQILLKTIVLDNTPGQLQVISHRVLGPTQSRK